MELPEFEEIINQVAYFADKLKDEFSSELLKNRLNELPEQQEIWLPYGDSINICLKKTSNSYFEITVINIGESPYHPRIILNGALTVSLELN